MIIILGTLNEFTPEHMARRKPIRRVRSVP